MAHASAITKFRENPFSRFGVILLTVTVTETALKLNLPGEGNSEKKKQGIGLLMKTEGLDFERWKFPMRDSIG